QVAPLNPAPNPPPVGAPPARLFKGEQLLFRVADGLRWEAPTQIGHAESVNYRQIKAAVPNTREKNYLVIPHTADIGEGISRPDAIEALTPTGAPTAEKSIRPPRFIFANRD